MPNPEFAQNRRESLRLPDFFMEHETPALVKEKLASMWKKIAELPTALAERFELLRAQYRDARDAIQFSAVEKEIGVLLEALPQIAKSLDVDTRAKALTAIGDVLPLLGATYAVLGRHVTFSEEQGGLEYHFEKIDGWKRAEFLLDEVFSMGSIRKRIGFYITRNCYSV